MDYAAALLCLYLLFPTMNVQQKNMAYVCGKDKLTEHAEQEKCLQVKVFLGLEKEEVLEAFEEASLGTEPETDVPLPNGLETPEYGPQSEGSELANGADDKKSAAEVQYRNSQNRLRLFEYGEEQLAFNRSEKGERTIVSVNGKTISRLQYDDSYRIMNKIVWQNGATAKDALIVRRVIYLYAPVNNDATPNADAQNQKPPLYTKPIAITDEHPVEKKITETTYDDNGNPVTVMYSHFIDDPDAVKAAEEKKIADEKQAAAEKKAAAANVKPAHADGETALVDTKPAPADGKTAPGAEKTQKFPQKKILDRKTVRTYNSDNKLLTEEETTYYDAPDPLRRGKKRASILTKTNVYEYTEKASVPDFRFYENGKLRMSTLYIDPDTYENTMYFDNEYLVKTKYSHGRKVLEGIYSGSKMIKRQKFEE